MNSIIARIKQIAFGAALAAVLVTATTVPSRGDGPLVPAPKLPPPPIAQILSDGTILYVDGSILYPNGIYVSADGTVTQL